MKVIKIGGGCLTNAQNIKKIRSILLTLKKERTVLVVSALGKTTNMLEEAVLFFLEDEKSKGRAIFKAIKKFHLDIIKELFPENKSFHLEIENIFEETSWKISTLDSGTKEFILDQILPIGEMISSRIVFQFVKKIFSETSLLDAKDFIITDTDSNYGNANVSIPKTCIKSICKIRDAFHEGKKLIITQGFIGSNSQGFNTTLGREGSDYTAALLANFLMVDEAIFFKNVKGVMTKDPAVNPLAKLIPELTYQKFKELQDTGVIGKLLYPKCVSLLEKGRILFYIRPFNDLSSKGTLIK